MGDPKALRGRVWRIAWPLILSNVSAPLLGMVDTAVLGHLDSAHYLGAVAVGAVAFSFLYTAFNFLRMGTTGLAAQAAGRRDTDELRTVLGQAVVLALGLALVMLVLRGPIGSAVFSLIGAPAEITAEAQVYYDVRIASAPATLANFALMGWFIGVQNSRAPLVIVLVINTVNIVLDIVFVPVLGMTTRGVALASVLAEYAGLAVGLALTLRELARRPGRWLPASLFDRARVRRLLAVNSDLLLRTLTLMAAFAILTAVGARQGETVLAANAILLNFIYLMSYALDGFANAAEGLVGESIGAGDPDGLAIVVQACTRYSIVVAGLFALTYAVTGPLIIDLLTGLDPVRSAARAYLPWLIAAPLLCVWSYLYDGVFVGATMSSEMRNTMLFAFIAVYVPLLYLLVGPFGNHGLWAAFLMFNVARGAGQHWIWRRMLAAGGTLRVR
jgi:MATE family multidrug resistance protein